MALIKHGLKKYSGLLLALGVLLVWAGCAQTEKEAQPDPFFEKWKTMSMTAKGTSPVDREFSIDASEEVVSSGDDMDLIGETEEEEMAPERPLPSQPVTMRMKDSEVGVVLRAIARGVGQNLLINSNVTGRVSVEVKAVPWNEVFLSILNSQGLRYAWEGDIIRIMTAEDMEKDLAVQQVQERTKRQKLVAKSVEPLLMKVVQIDYADPEGLVEPLNSILATSAGENAADKSKKDKSNSVARGSVDVDKHNNSLVLMAVREDLKKMLALINKLDRPPYQVHIKANIVETSRDTARDLGIQWGWMYGRYDSLGNDTDFWLTPGGNFGSAASRDAPLTGAYTAGTGSKGVSGQGNGINFPVDFEDAMGATMGLMFGKVGSNILEVQLSALAEAGKINILSTPSITTLDNQTASTENGTEVPYVTINEDGDREVKFKDATLMLEITPHVIDEGQMKMKVEIKKDEVDLSNTVDGNPFILKKRTSTNLIVRNGETIVISGLSKTRNAEGDTGIPWLKDIPGLGYLFKGESKAEAMEEVLIFLTPNVLPKPGEAMVQEQNVNMPASAGGNES
ncbi:type IV pilus assembly protein PilQ [Desulfatibacillum alkenivorans DSM 16219]|uniref:Type IV pilus assembly protein PilQ n=1 Tax=Desulfatibacillum alkenivorans DSM 16219 TaxID=1121393 RepID=A0A1M6NWY9_9BACT|nr:type IV pilus secretin PilQ [Desulfatibacillum alkenivorans]SHK00203.1 type IV pilus assembly protein PilQ [Desulfatibacillum alkenivorans DSM 16219]